MITSQDLNEFKIEAYELLDTAEKSLLALEEGEEFRKHFDAIFRTFHNLKGASAMMDLVDLESHMHQLENILMGFKDRINIPSEYLDLFLRGIDATKTILSGQQVHFDFSPNAQTLQPSKDANESSSENKKELTYPNFYKTIKILVIEDQLTLKESLKLVLKKANFNLAFITPEQLTPETFLNFCPDVVINCSNHFNKDVAQAIEKIDADITILNELSSFEESALELCVNAYKNKLLLKLVNKALHLLLYQYSDLKEYLESSKKTEIHTYLHKEITQLMEDHRSFVLFQEEKV